VGTDVDPAAVEAARERLGRFGPRFTVQLRSYAEVAEVLDELGIDRLVAAVLDLGISSALLDGEGGFSFRQDGPLDMRMDSGLAVTARDLLNGSTAGELAEMFREYGEIRGAGPLARAIESECRLGRMERTSDLVRVVQDVFPSSGARQLSRAFQAVRIAVNCELDNLSRFLAAVAGRLEIGGRVAVLSFHSLEDRIVKHAFQEWERAGTYRRGTRRPVLPDEAEVRANRRARSAKMRWAERVAA
ncbi:MAG: 16S rRNA (cytosine(1402)-N(4))-methyltransferase RsmH, partial [Deltaproteobacteria bacterium]|nr:16S rRNA (cytosine(1402)-N(4))-methyltransferase RsmH [Deltaproteobacteria bacterium]